MLLAPKLKKRDTIGVVVPSNPVSSEDNIYALEFKQLLERQGFKVTFCEDFQKTNSLGISGGNVAERIRDVNKFINDTNISCIWFFQGGDTANQLVEYIDYEGIKNNPKVFIGKSDCDLLLNAIQSQTGLITFHGCDAKLGDTREMDFEYTQKAFYSRFVLGKKDIEASENTSRYTLKAGEATGKVFGCNLRCILKLAGTKYFPKLKEDFIFLIEGYKITSSELTFFLEQFRMLGVLERCVGIVIGHSYEFDGGALSVDDVVCDFFRDYNIPIMKTHEFGHYQPHAFLPIGAEIYMNTNILKITSDFIK